MAVDLAERDEWTQNEVARLSRRWGWGRSLPMSSLIQARFSVSKEPPWPAYYQPRKRSSSPQGLVLPFLYVSFLQPKGTSAVDLASE